MPSLYFECESASYNSDDYQNTLRLANVEKCIHKVDTSVACGIIRVEPPVLFILFFTIIIIYATSTAEHRPPLKASTVTSWTWPASNATLWPSSDPTSRTSLSCKINGVLDESSQIKVPTHCPYFAASKTLIYASSLNNMPPWSSQQHTQSLVYYYTVLVGSSWNVPPIEIRTTFRLHQRKKKYKGTKCTEELNKMYRF